MATLLLCRDKQLEVKHEASLSDLSITLIPIRQMMQH